MSGLLPALLQVPAYIVLYGVIRGLAHTVDGGRVATPLYVNRSTRLAHSLHGHPGHLQALGMNLSSSLFGVHGSWTASIPYAALMLGSIALQWFQTRLVNRRASEGVDSQRGQAIQRYLPLVFALVYLRLPAGVNIYIAASAACRIAIQHVALRPLRIRPPRSGEYVPDRPPQRLRPARWTTVVGRLPGM